MWQFLVGFGLGIYMGTQYNCKPQLNSLIKTIKINFPERKN